MQKTEETASQGASKKWGIKLAMAAESSAWESMFLIDPLKKMENQ